MAPAKTAKKELSQTRLPFAATKTAGAKSDAKEQVVLPPAQQRAKDAEARAKLVVIPSKSRKRTRTQSQSTIGSEDEEKLTFVLEQDGTSDDNGEPDLPEPEEEVDSDEGEVHIEVVAETDEEEDTTAAAKGKHKIVPLKDLMKEPEFKAHYKQVTEALCGELTDSAAGESKATTILRRFDLNYDYGGTVGISRMERWDRAAALGLDPPPIVRRILETEQVEKLTDEQLENLRQSVFHDLV